MNSSVTPPRDVRVTPIAPDTFVFRSRTWERLKFEIEYGLQRGTTANSYLIRSDRVALFDPPGESFTKIFLGALTGRIAPETIDYIVLGHINPNRAVTLGALLDLVPGATLVCSNPGAISARKILDGRGLDILVVKGEESLDLGRDHILEFIPTPNARFPDHLCTFDRGTGVLFTDKIFGAHVCGDQVLDEGWSVYREDRRFYFERVMAPHARQVGAALEKILAKNAAIHAVGHGPLVRQGLQELNLSYRQWLAEQGEKGLTVALIYASAYGNTGTLAGAIAVGITKAGVAVEAIDAESADPEEIKTAVERSDGFLFGTPTLGGHAPTQIQTALGITLANGDKSKPVGIFGSYGWSGEAIDLLESKFRDAGYRFGFEPIRVKFRPTDAILKTCEEAGTDFAQALKKARKARRPKENVDRLPSDRTEQALGRIVGSLCIVTCERGEVRGAMLASWVSQATFTPPGLTLAVARERAIESLLYTGNPFVLNILAEGRHSALMKHFLKPFTPGEDRFAGLDIESADNGSPILKDALAYLECRVAGRMECGDHWVIYATADKGKVLREGLTAIHHRKSGNHY